MVHEVDRDEVMSLLDRGAKLIEVLPHDEYELEHLPTAENIPLAELTADRVAHLRRDEPIVVYCADTECDVSPRAARRLQSLGFRDVSDYVGGKDDWLASGLPFEGRAGIPRISAIARSNVPTVGPDTSVGSARDRLREEAPLLVLDDQRVVLGRVYGSQLEEADPDVPVAEVMDPGPATYRPHVPAEELLELLEDRDLGTAVVTTSGGELIGVVDREGLEEAVREPGEMRRLA
jgi:rhodanese-related sulfurtransferase/CBS domain-containing protein